MTKSTTIHELIERSANAGLELQRNDGSFPSGQNLSYKDQETPVRSTALWAIIYLRAYDITGEQKFSKVADEAIDFLLQEKNRPNGYTFYARETEKKDKCNGLVGQAHPIRALARAAITLDREDALEVAENVFSIHPFNKNVGLWEGIEIDGSLLSFDRTLNHQLSFAVSGCNLLQARTNSDIMSEIKTFISELKNNLRVGPNGRVRHYVRPPITNVIDVVWERLYRWNLIVNEISYNVRRFSDRHSKKEAGYHPMNLKLLSDLHNFFPDHPLWSTKKVKNCLEYINNTEYRNAFDDKISPYGNMIQGFGNAYATLTFTDQQKLAEKWIGFEIHHRFDFERDLLIKNVSDSNFQAATIAAIVDFPNIEFELNEDPPLRSYNTLREGS